MKQACVTNKHKRPKIRGIRKHFPKESYKKNSQNRAVNLKMFMSLYCNIYGIHINSITTTYPFNRFIIMIIFLLLPDHRQRHIFTLIYIYILEENSCVIK